MVSAGAVWPWDPGLRAAATGGTARAGAGAAAGALTGGLGSGIAAAADSWRSS